MKRHIANAISLSRLALFVPWSLLRVAHSVWALPVMAVIVATDLLDGPIARRMKTAGPFGGALDAACDAAVSIAAAIVIGLWDVRFLAAAALMGFNALSWLLYRSFTGGKTYTRLGRYNGAACYALIALEGAGQLADPLFPQAAAIAVTAGLAIAGTLLAVSSVENIAALFRSRGARTPV